MGSCFYPRLLMRKATWTYAAERFVADLRLDIGMVKMRTAVKKRAQPSNGGFLNIVSTLLRKWGNLPGISQTKDLEWFVPVF